MKKRHKREESRLEKNESDFHVNARSQALDMDCNVENCRSMRKGKSIDDTRAKDVPVHGDAIV